MIIFFVCVRYIHLNNANKVEVEYLSKVLQRLFGQIKR